MAMEEWKVGVGGGGGVGLGMGGGMGLGEGGWSIAGRRGGMLFCWFSLTVKKKSFILLFLVCLKPEKWLKKLLSPQKKLCPKVS